MQNYNTFSKSFFKYEIFLCTLWNIIIRLRKSGLMDKIQAKKLHKPLFYLPLQAFEKMNKKSAFTVVVK